MNKWAKLSWIAGFVFFSLVLTIRFILEHWFSYLWIPLSMALGFFGFAIFKDFRFYFDFFTLKTTKSGMSMGAALMGALIILLTLNFIGFRKNYIVDVTQEKLFSLSDQTKQILDMLEAEAELIVLHRGKKDTELVNNFREIAKLYKSYNNQLKISLHNVNIEADLGKEYLDKNDGFTVVVKYGVRKVRVERANGAPISEEQLTSALLKSSKKEEKVIYFLTGHGERDIELEEEGIKSFAEALRESAYEVRSLSLVEGAKIPADADVIAIIGPQVKLLDGEIEMLHKYAMGGGGLLVTGDPGLPHNLQSFLKPLGVIYHNNYIINDRVSIMGSAITDVLGTNFSRENDITKNFGGAFTLFSISSEVSIDPSIQKELVGDVLVKSHETSYSVSDLTLFREVQERRMHSIGVSGRGRLDNLQKPETANNEKWLTGEFAIAVYGDSDFLVGGTLSQGLNRDLALNTVSFLANDSNLISIRPKAPIGSKLELTSVKANFILVIGLIIPFLFFSLGGVFWYKRRTA